MTYYFTSLVAFFLYESFNLTTGYKLDRIIGLDWTLPPGLEPVPHGGRAVSFAVDGLYACLSFLRNTLSQPRFHEVDSRSQGILFVPKIEPQFVSERIADSVIQYQH